MGLLGRFKTFKGGVHPPEAKELSEHKAFEIMPDPTQVVLPLLQHIGKPSKVLVKKGDEVKTGTLLAEQDGFISSPIYSSVSGKILKIASNANVGGNPKESIFITPGEGEEIEKFEELNPETVTPEQIRERVKKTGIVGQGGAAFPTFVKLTPPEGIKIDCVIINGCECEPYLTRDYRFMLEYTKELIGGLKLMMKALGVDRGVIGIEDNKPEAIKKLEEACSKEKGIFVEALKTKYPQGAEKMLIVAATGKQVSPGKLPLDVGVVIQNIGTAIQVYDAVVKGMPPVYAALTVSGKGIKEPKNLFVKIGTPIKEVIDFCGGINEKAVKIVVGGPMMGVAQYDLSASVTKATSGILALTAEEVNTKVETNCVKCAKCIDVCPLGLMPTKLARLSQLGRFEDAEQFNITTCMECGTCTYTCPANIPLVQWMRLGKQQVIKLQRTRKS